MNEGIGRTEGAPVFAPNFKASVDHVLRKSLSAGVAVMCYYVVKFHQSTRHMQGDKTYFICLVLSERGYN